MDQSLKRRTKDSKTVSGTGLRGGNVEDEVDGCSTVQAAELTVPRQGAERKDRETLSATRLKQVVEGRCLRRGRRLQHRPACTWVPDRPVNSKPAFNQAV